jgi:hypothetical protein
VGEESPYYEIQLKVTDERVNKTEYIVVMMCSRYKEIPVAEMELILQTLSTPDVLDLTDYDLLVYGGGGQSKSYYKALRNDPEVEILWTGWSGGKWTSLLSFIPGEAGLVKVLNQNRLKSLFEDLASHSVSDLYYVPKELTEKIKGAVISRPSSHRAEKILENETRFFYLQAELDETVITNGKECYLFDIVVGADLPQDLKVLFSDI